MEVATTEERGSTCEVAAWDANLLVAVDDIRVHAKVQCQRDHLKEERNRHGRS